MMTSYPTLIIIIIPNTLFMLSVIFKNYRKALFTKVFLKFNQSITNRKLQISL